MVDETWGVAPGYYILPFQGKGIDSSPFYSFLFYRLNRGEEDWTPHQVRDDSILPFVPPFAVGVHSDNRRGDEECGFVVRPHHNKLW
jgi:hypothetical protein